MSVWRQKQEGRRWDGVEQVIFGVGDWRQLALWQAARVLYRSDAQLSQVYGGLWKGTPTAITDWIAQSCSQHGGRRKAQYNAVGHAGRVSRQAGPRRGRWWWEWQCFSSGQGRQAPQSTQHHARTWHGYHECVRACLGDWSGRASSIYVPLDVGRAQPGLFESRTDLGCQVVAGEHRVCAAVMRDGR